MIPIFTTLAPYAASLATAGLKGFIGKWGQ